MRKSLVCGSVLAGLLTGNAEAGVIDFQDVASASGGCEYHGIALQSGGFNFAGNAADPDLFVCDAGVLQHNTSPALINANSRSILTMAAASGGTFSLLSFYAGGRTEAFNPDGAVDYYSVATGIDILGHLFGGGTVSTSIVLDSTAPYDWAQYVLPASFTNLTSVVMTAQGQGDIPEFLIDDIEVNEPSQVVPEPGSLALLGMGLAGLAARRQRKSR